MSKIWPFVSGVIIGAAGVVTAALGLTVAYGEGGLDEQRDKHSLLALCEGNDTSE